MAEHLLAAPGVSKSLSALESVIMGTVAAPDPSQASNLNVFTLFESIDYGLDEAIDHRCRIGLCQARYLCNLPYDISFGHDRSSVPYNSVP